MSSSKQIVPQGTAQSLLGVPPEMSLKLAKSALSATSSMNTYVTMIMLAWVLVLALLAYLVYYCVTVQHPRIFLFGHSEPYEAFMEMHMRRVVNDIKVLSEGSHVPEPLKEIVSFIIKKQVIPSKVVKSNGSITYKDAPLLYTFFMFRDAMKKDKSKLLALIPKMMQMKNMQLSTSSGTVTVNLYDKKGIYFNDKICDEDKNLLSEVFELATINEVQGKYRDEKDPVQVFKAGIGSLNVLYRYFKSIDEDYEKNLDAHKESHEFNASVPLPGSTVGDDCKQEDKDKISQEMSRITLYLNFYKYFDEISRAFLLRRTGGVANFTIFSYYMEEYVNYTKDVLVTTWEPYFVTGEDIKKTAVWMQSAITSETAQNFIMKIPLKLSGIEDNEKEEFVDKLLKPFMIIPKTFFVLIKIAESIVSAISDPLKIFRIIIGLIVGTFIFVLYTIVLALSLPISLACSAVWLFLYKLFKSLLALCLFILIALLYVILWILDYATGGAILKLLRCENLPDIWHMVPGYAMGNVYKRTFVCSYPCSKRFVPNGDGWCKRCPDYQPPFCPQQLIYNAFLSTKDKIFESKLKVKPDVHDYSPGVQYFLKDKDERDRILSEAYDNKIDFAKKCNGRMRHFDYITRFICKHRKLLIDKEKYPDLYNKASKFCKFAYCEYVFDNDSTSHKPMMQFKTEKADEVPCFCDELTSNQTDNAGGTSERTSLFEKLIIIIIVIIVIVLIVVSIYTYGITQPIAFLTSAQRE